MTHGRPEPHRAGDAIGISSSRTCRQDPDQPAIALDISAPLGVLKQCVGTPPSRVPTPRFPQTRQPTAPPLRGPDGIGATNMKFRPLHDRVALRRVDSETKTSGGIIIPDTAAEKPQQGEVIAVGPGARGEDGKIVPLDLKKGDGPVRQMVRHRGQDRRPELLIMKESDIMGVLAN